MNYYKIHCCFINPVYSNKKKMEVRGALFNEHQVYKYIIYDFIFKIFTKDVNWDDI